MVLLKTLNRIDGEYSDIRDFISKSLEKICRNENLPLQQVVCTCFSFLCCCLYHNLWLAMFYYHKPKIENNAFDYRFEI